MDTSPTGFSDFERPIIQRALASTSVPIIQCNGTDAAFRGTGALLRTPEGCYLLTARHVVTEVPRDQLGVPLGDGGEVLSLKGAPVYGSDEVTDLAAIPIDQGSALRQLMSAWEVLNLSDVRQATSGSATRFIVAGFPRATGRLDVESANLRATQLTQIYTRPYLGPLPSERDDDDFFLQYGRTAKGAAGEPKATLPLEGISGAMVWAVAESTIWDARSVLQLAGFQVAYTESGYLRCKRWDAMARLLDQIHVERARPNAQV